MTDFKTAHKRKRKYKPRLYDIVEDNFAMTVTSKWKPDFNKKNRCT